MSIKKTLASLLVAGAVALGAGSKANAETIFQDGFEGQDYYDNPVGWELNPSYYGRWTSAAEITSGYKSQNGLAFNCGETLNRATIHFSTNQPKINIEWYQRLGWGGGQVNGSDTLGLVKDEVTNDPYYCNAYIGFKDISLNHIYNSSPLGVKLLELGDTNSWIKYQISIDESLGTIGYSAENIQTGEFNEISGLHYNEIPSEFSFITNGYYGGNYTSYGSFVVDDVSITATPEPSTLELLAIAGLGAGVYALRKQKGGIKNDNKK